MFSLRGVAKNLSTLALILVLLVSAYVTLVPTIGLFSQSDLIESLALFDYGNSSSAIEFHVGDTLVVVANVKGADTYSFTINDRTGEVFSNTGNVHGPRVEVNVPLYPPKFKAEGKYSVIFYANAFDRPLPGVSLSDIEATAFTVLATDTKLKLDVNYSEVSNQLALEALLTNVDGEAVTNQTVDFYLQLNGNVSARNRGWVPLQSSNTNVDGVACLDFAADLVSGFHYLKAEFKGDENFVGAFDRAHFVVKPCASLIQVVGVNKYGDGVDVVARVTSQHGYPLSGKTVMVEFGDSLEVEPIYAVTNGDGEIIATLKGVQDQSVIEAAITTLEDEFSLDTRVEVAVNPDVDTYSSTTFESSSSTVFESGGGGGGSGEVDVTIYPAEPYAVLPVIVNATYVSEKLYDDYFNFTFYLDGSYELKEMNATVEEVEGNYTYTALYIWCPDVLGNHYIDVVAEGRSLPPQPRSISEQGSVSFNVSRCPSNLVVHFPQAVYGNTSRLTAAFSRARAYQLPDSSGYYYEYVLAPQMTYGDANYTLDECVQSAQVEFYVNGTLEGSSVVTNDTGLAALPLSLNFSETYLTLNITVVVVPSLYTEGTVERIVTFTKVHVNQATTQNESFELNYTIINPNGGEEVYKELENQIEAESYLFGLPVWNASVSTIVARFIAPSDTLDFGWTWVPSGSDYLRLWKKSGGDRVLFLSSGDCNGDGMVDEADDVVVLRAWGTTPEDPMWDPRADLNRDYVVNGADKAIVDGNWGTTGEWVIVDGGSCGRIPFGAERVAVYKGYQLVGDDIDFFEIILDGESSTDNLGVAGALWVPAEIGMYLVQVKLPSSFDVAVAFRSNVTQVDASVNLVNYFNVSKRPIRLHLESLPGQLANQTGELDDTAIADAYVYSNFPYSNFGGDAYLKVGMGAGGERRSYVQFDVSAIPSGAAIHSATLNLYCTFSNLTVSVHQVTSSWTEEGITWNNQPSFVSTPTDSTSEGSGGWCSWDVIRDVQAWVDGAAVNHGFVLMSDGQHTFYSRDSIGSKKPVLDITYLPTLPTNVTLRVDGFDEGAGEPASGLPIEFSVNDESLGTVYTDSNGTALKSWVPSYCIVYNVKVASPEDAIVEAAEANDTIDFRRNTVLRLWNGGEEVEDYGSVSVSTYTSYTFDAAIYMDFHMGIPDLTVEVYVNSTHYATTNKSDSYGKAPFRWDTDKVGVHDFRLVFEGLQYYQQEELHFVALAEATPVSLYFDVSPKEFEPGTTLTLWAKAVNTVTNSSLTGLRLQFLNEMGLIDELMVNSTGEVSTTWQYPDDGAAHTVMVRVHPDDEDLGNKSLASQPVTLKVSRKTSLVLTVEREHSSTSHIIAGRLTSDSTPLAGRTIKVKVNGNEYDLTTDGDGRFSLTRDLQPRNDQTTTYQVTATFEGDQPQSATANATAPDGTSYPVCTTIQYGYKPSSNRVTVTVEPPATVVDTTEESTVTEQPESTIVEVPPPKTPEEMQAEAEQEGWLQIWHEFAWWWPFYRLHIRITIGSALIHIAFNPVLPGGEIVEISNLGTLFPAFDPELGIDQETVNRIVEQTIKSVALGMVALTATAIAASYLSIPGAIVSLTIYSLGVIASFASAYIAFGAGEKTKALSILVATSIITMMQALGAFMGALFLGKAAFVVKAIAAPVLASFLANLVDAAPLADAIIVAMIGITVGILVSLTVRRIGDPTTAFWLTGYISINLISAHTAYMLYKEWVNY